MSVAPATQGTTWRRPGLEIAPSAAILMRQSARTDENSGGAIGRKHMTTDTAKRAAVTDEALEARVRKVFDEYINPALKSHGGFANLVKVEKGDVYVELGGGCRGCPGARATMRNGIEMAIREDVPEIGRVIDATNHGA
jgi:Fe-S cluster biogenesis protein NfuA